MERMVLVQMDKKVKLIQNCLKLVVWLELVLIKVKCCVWSEFVIWKKLGHWVKLVDWVGDATGIGGVGEVNEVDEWRQALKWMKMATSVKIL